MLHAPALNLNPTHAMSSDARLNSAVFDTKCKPLHAPSKKRSLAQAAPQARLSKIALAITAPLKRAISTPASTKSVKQQPRAAHAFLDAVGAGRSLGQYSCGEAVFLQGDAADAVFYIQTGKVQITVVSKHGKEGVVAMLSAGEFFGEGCLAGQTLHIATATAMDESTVVKIDKQAMIREMRDDPGFSQMFMAFLLSRNIQVEADLIDHLFNSSEKRLARILLLLANIGTEGRVETVPRINQETLAARVGTTRSRINFFMNKFRDLGFIEYTTGAVKVHSSLLSVIVHD